MSSVEQQEPTICQLCEKIIFCEDDDAVHFRCATYKEKHLTEMVSHLQSQVIAMKKAFTKVEDLMKNIGLALSTGVSSEDDIRPAASRSKRQTTKEKTVQAAQKVSSKKGSKKDAISPLVFPNGSFPPTVEQPTVNVSTNKRNITTTTVRPLMPTPSSSINQFEAVSDIQSNITPPNVTVDDSGSNQLTYADVLSNGSSSEASIPLLKCIPPPRSIFLSGFDPELTERDLKDYARYNLNSTIELNVRKMNFREPKPYASFVIDAGRDSDLFDALCDPRFWPEHAIVHEYEFFRKPRARVQMANQRRQLPSPV